VQRAEETELRVAILSGDTASARPERSNGQAAGTTRTTVVARPRSPEAG
jgi:hypothetical protein